MSDLIPSSLSPSAKPNENNNGSIPFPQFSVLVVLLIAAIIGGIYGAVAAIVRPLETEIDSMKAENLRTQAQSAVALTHAEEGVRTTLSKAEADVQAAIRETDAKIQREVLLTKENIGLSITSLSDRIKNLEQNDRDTLNRGLSVGAIDARLRTLEQKEGVRTEEHVLGEKK